MRARPIAPICLITMLLLCLLSPPVRAGSEEMTLHLEGAVAPFSDACFIEDGAAYVPLAAFAEEMGGCKVAWDGTAARVSADGLQMRAAPGEQWVEANGRYFYAPGGVRLLNGRTYAPLGALGRVWGLELHWDGSERTVSARRTGAGFPEAGETYYDPETLDLLSRIISAESRGERLAGQIAVGTVVLNRTVCEDFPDTIPGVIFDPGQFEPVANGTIHDPPYFLSVIAAKLCLDGAREAGDSLFFFAPALSPGTWIVDHRPYCTTIGCHRFYL